MHRIDVIIAGRVQGVWFRKYTQDKARELGLTGWIRNEANGTVALIAEGDDEPLKKLTKWLQRGSPGAKVNTVNVNWEEARETLKTFEIIR